MTDTMRDGGARQRAITALGSVLVQAPAGSGKTTLLAQRYLRLLTTVEAPESILALTFTRRAAQEMQERVMRALEAGAQTACPAWLNPQTWELGVAARRHLSRFGVDIERHPSRLRIETIDSFNAWIAGQLPITAGAGARLSMVDDAWPLYREAARRALAHDDADLFGAAVERVLELDDQRWKSLVKLISGMLSSRDRWLPLLAGRLAVTIALDDEQLARVRQHLDEDLALLVARRLRAACETLGRERLDSLATLLHAAAKRSAGILVEWRSAAAPLSAAADDIPRWRSMAKLLLTNDGTYRKRLTVKEGFPVGCLDKEPMMDLLTELERQPRTLRALVEIRLLPDPLYSDEQWARVREVAQVLVLSAAQLEQVFREQGVVDFPAVSMAALRALGSADAPTDLSLRLDYRLQHILVDEFQDTSSAQLELVKLLTAGWQRDDGRSIFCVGDPMQSIYGFRQAEVRAFLELAEDGIGEVQFDVQRLTSNFRSAKVLVDWINHSFAHILPLVDDRDRGAIAFRPSDAARGAAGDDSSAVGSRGFLSRRAEADAIAELIEGQRSLHPEWRIVILVRAKTHAREIAGCLHARRIAFNAVDIEPLRERAVVRDLTMLAAGLLHLGDRTAWLAILRAPWVGLTLADLLGLARAAPLIWDALMDEAVLGALSVDGQARCRRFRETMQAAFRVRNDGSLTRWIERTWLALGGPSCVTSELDLTHAAAVFRRLRELETRGLPDAAELRESFADLFADCGAPAAVEIMTIHKSKGLEFDLVVVPALDRHLPNHGNQLLLSHEFARDERDGMVMAARPGVGVDDDPLFDFLQRQTRDASSLEAERLLYVACTRAKSQLHLTAVVGHGEEGWEPRSGSLLAVLWPVLRADFELVDARTAAADAEAMRAPSAPPGGALLRVPSGWTAPPLFAVDDSLAAVASTTRSATPVFDWAGETARRVGSLVHAELQVMEVETLDAQSIAERAPHFRRWLAQQGVPEQRLPDAGARVVTALQAVLADPRGQWILKKGYRVDLREYALSGRWRGSIIRVVFDRSFVDEQGVRWIIDYKTSHHGGGDLDGFLDREVERYSPQLERYAELARHLGPEPIRVGLYFPLMRAWREWSP